MLVIPSEARNLHFVNLDPVLWLVPHGVTVGPVSAPEKVESAGFLKDVGGMIDEAVQQGWILSTTLARELRNSVDTAVELLQKDDGRAAREVLESVLKQVEEEKDGALLSEAYALLKYNIEFLLPRLKPAT